MSTLHRLPKCDLGTDIGRPRQTARWNKGIIQCIQYQCGHNNLAQMRLGGGQRPLVLRAFEPVDRPSEDIIKSI